VYQLVFSCRHRYGLSEAGIELPVSLALGKATVHLMAKLDTGAALCIFQRQFGEALGLEVERGLRQEMATATGRFLTYGHAVALSTLGIDFELIAYFAADPLFYRNVLGRRGFLEQLRLGLVDREATLYVGRDGE